MSNIESKNGSIEIIRMSNSSWFKIRCNGAVIHLDPGFSGMIEEAGIPMNELEEHADFIFVSHCHQDHFRKEIVEKIAHEGTMIIAPPCLHEHSEILFHSIRPGDRISIFDLTLQAVNAYNTPEGRSTRKFHEKGHFVGYLVGLGKRVLYFAGDTDVIPDMKKLGPVDLAFLPIGGTYVMDLEEAVDAVGLIRPKMVIGMHQGEYSLESFKEKVQKKLHVDAKVMYPGDHWTVSF